MPGLAWRRAAARAALVSLVTFASSSTRTAAAQTAVPPEAPPPAPAVAAAPSAASPTTPPPAATATCDPSVLEPVARRVTPSILEAEGPLAWSFAVAFGEPELVVVSAMLVGAGRGVIVSHDGRTTTASIVAADDDLAVLRVPGLAAKPLTASPIAVQRGTGVVAFGRPWDEEGGADQVSPGVVTAVGGGRFRTDGAVAYATRIVAPVVDCEGRVLGFSTGVGDEVIPVSRAEALVRHVRSGRPAPEVGWWVAPSMRGTLELDDHPWGGLELGLSAVAEDHVELGVHGRFAAWTDETGRDDQGWSTLRHRVRGGIDLRAGARLLLTEGAVPLYLVPHVGVGADVGWTGGERMREQIEAEGCSAEAPCPVLGARLDLPSSIDRDLGPQIGLAFRVGPLEASYLVRLDLLDEETPVHRLGFGVAF